VGNNDIMVNKTFRYTKTARDQIALYSIDPYWLNDRIKEEKWKRKGKTEEYQLAFIRRGAVYTIRVADYEDYILLISIHKTTSRRRLKEVKRSD
jgi:hypothetical protein